MKNANLTVTTEELKAILKYFFQSGMRYHDRLNCSAGRWEDRGEEDAPNFTNLFESVFITKTIEPKSLNINAG